MPSQQPRRVDRHTHGHASARGRGGRDGLGACRRHPAPRALRERRVGRWCAFLSFEHHTHTDAIWYHTMMMHDDAHDLVPSSSSSCRHRPPPAPARALRARRPGVLSSASSFDGVSSSSSRPSLPPSLDTPQLNYMMQDLDMPRDARIRCRQYFHQSKRIHRLHTYTTLEVRPVRRRRCTLHPIVVWR